MRTRAPALLAVLAIGCSPPPPAVVPAAAPTRAALTGLLEQGCYRCLETAFTAARDGGVSDLAFEAAALLVLRSKELGLPVEPWLERAGALVAANPFWRTYLDIAGAIPPDPLSANRDALAEVQGRMQARLSMAAWLDSLREGALSLLFREYLRISLVCSYGRLDVDERSFSDPLHPVAATPLYQYRLALCGVTPRERLASLQASHPEWVDADYAIGRAEAEDPIHPDPESGLKHLESAGSAFPASPAIATTIGNVHRAWEDWEPALTAYDAALAIAPGHAEAMIGRIISLSRLARPDAAVAAATALIDSGLGRRGEAYYWRAWNQLSLGHYDAARADADRARRLMVNAAVFVLSGTIEWRLQRLAAAEADFQQALTIDFGECEAAFDLAVVRDALGKRAESLAAFEQARRCYDLSRTLRGEAIARIHAGPGTDTMKARAAAIHERALAELEDRYREVVRAIEVLKSDTESRPPRTSGSADPPRVTRVPAASSALRDREAR
jgi:tetratricopeptide (TPR) repeat protein